MATDIQDIASGRAALSICESLMLAMGDLKIIGENDAVGVIKDAASAHRGAGTSTEEKAMHSAIVDILDRIVAGGNSVRRR
jgi:hypothetical protein